ncbi:MAG: hypothetical protein P8X49_14305, partial [Syntrophobacterales bacterium]
CPRSPNPIIKNGRTGFHPVLARQDARATGEGDVRGVDRAVGLRSLSSGNLSAWIRSHRVFEEEGEE